MNVISRIEKSNETMVAKYFKNEQIQTSNTEAIASVPLAVPEDSLSITFDASEFEEITANRKMTKNDEKKVKKEMKNLVESMIQPLITYMKLLGLTNATNNVRLQKPLLAYNISVLICLNYHTVHKLLLLSYDGFTAQFAFAVANALFFASGGICAWFLFFIQKNLVILNENVISQVSLFDQNFYHSKKIRQISKIMVAAILACSCITVLYDCKIIRERYVADAFHDAHLFIDCYIAFMTQSVLMTCTAIYVLPSYILAYCLDKFTDDMYRVGIMLDDKMKSENALIKVESFQKRYQILKKASNIIEINFKYIAFYVQTVCLIELSCLLYAYLQNLKSQHWNWLEATLFIAFVGQIIFSMLSFILPAYLNYEKNEKITAMCPEIFEKEMRKNSNALLATKVLMFMYQLQTMPIIFTSGGFFVVKRSLLPTLVSFMLTYVFLMLQLGQTPKCLDKKYFGTL